MLVDDFEQYQNDKTDDVVVSQSGSDEPESEPLADDRENLSRSPWCSMLQAPHVLETRSTGITASPRRCRVSHLAVASTKIFDWFTFEAYLT